MTIKRLFVITLLFLEFIGAYWCGGRINTYIEDKRNPEYFISFQGWRDENTYFYGWNGYTISGGIKNGNDIKEISEYIKDHEHLSNVVILFYKKIDL